MPSPRIAWRVAALGGATAGLALSPALPAASAGPVAPALALGVVAGAALLVARPGSHRAARGVWAICDYI